MIPCKSNFMALLNLKVFLLAHNNINTSFVQHNVRTIAKKIF